MLRRSPTDGPVPARELQTASRASPSLLPPPSVTQWSLMSKVQRPSPLKPLLREKLRRLPNAPILDTSYDFTVNGEEIDGKNGSPAERRIRFLENSIKFLRREHEELLSALHQEVDSLKRTNQSTSCCVYTIRKFCIIPISVKHADVAILWKQICSTDLTDQYFVYCICRANSNESVIVLRH